MSASHELHHLVKQGNLDRVRELLNSTRPPEDIGIDLRDSNGYTPLMYAVSSSKAGVELVRLLLEHGADANRWGQALFEGMPCEGVLSLCLRGGDPGKLVALMEYGADIRYQGGWGYNALIDAACGRETERNPRLIDLLRLLMANGVPLNGISSYGESALRVLSRIGRFDAVRLLLDAGADETQLEWTPLIRAVAIGSLADVEAAVADGAPLEGRDRWQRTAWLVAVQNGDLAKARFLLERGADANARGQSGKTALVYAIENYRYQVLQWLIERGASVEQTDGHGQTPLMAAAQCGDAVAVDLLLKAGADANAVVRCAFPAQVPDWLSGLLERASKVGIDVNAALSGKTALAEAQDRESAMLLLNAGADPAGLTPQARRAILGLDPEADEGLLDVSLEDFRKGRSRRFGASNPEEIREPFWKAMIRAGAGAATAAHQYTGQGGELGSPVWCAERFGQSLTLLPDGRIVQIGGEHEDSYDWNFCIYNDVFVHHPDGTIQIFGYPESTFPPTDFHTATLIGGHIYIIGSLGYQGQREFGTTPVFRLDTTSFRIEEGEAGGDSPGWISGHRAVQVGLSEIRVSGGKVAAWDGERETFTRNGKSHVLDIERLVWRCE